MQSMACRLSRHSLSKFRSVTANSSRTFHGSSGQSGWKNETPEGSKTEVSREHFFSLLPLCGIPLIIIRGTFDFDPHIDLYLPACMTGSLAGIRVQSRTPDTVGRCG